MQAADPRTLRPTQLIRMLNSTPLGEVITDKALRRHRSQAGYRIGDDRTVDLLRYTAWLVKCRHTQPEASPVDVINGETAYDVKKERSRVVSARQSQSAMEIGELPPVKDPIRKERGEKDFQFFATAYFPEFFFMPWSDDHRRIIRKIQRAVIDGGFNAIAMPRGSGKTTIVITLCLWALLYGHREFLVLIGADEKKAESLIKAIKVQLQKNTLLLEDFPEACVPIRKKKGINQKRLLYRGEEIYMEFSADMIVMPDMPDSKAARAVVMVAGITGSLRGGTYTRTDNRIVRPDFFILDDPQTDESARSAQQCHDREMIIKQAILGLAGPKVKLAGVMPCTVIAPGDLSARVLDRDRHPEWQGERTQLVYSFPKNEGLWKTYRDIRSRGLKEDRGTDEATEFYRTNREAMDFGAIVAWPERYKPDEISAVQNAMNLRYDVGDEAFFAEYQNDPQLKKQSDADQLTAEKVLAKMNRQERGKIPVVGCTHVSMFIDVHEALLYFGIVAWEPNFTGYLIDFGTYPEQPRSYFKLRDAAPTMEDMEPGLGMEGWIYAGLEKLTQSYLSREFIGDDGTTLRVGRCLVDSRWGMTTDLIFKFCRFSPFASVLMPSQGKYVGARERPFAEYKRQPGEQIGDNWIIKRGTRAIRFVSFDTNHWKTFLVQRLAASMGSPGSLSLFGDDPDEQAMLADHVTGEFGLEVTGRGRTVTEWKQHVDQENHGFDVLVGCAVGASIMGVKVPAGKVTKPPRGKSKRKKSVSYL